MTDSASPSPERHPVTPDQPSGAADAQPAPSTPPDAPPAQTTPPDSPGASGRRRAAGVTGQVVGVIGVVVSLALVAGVLLGRGWLVTQVDDVAGAIDSTIARTTPLIDAADAAVDQVGQEITAAVDAAGAVVADRAASSDLLQGLLARVNALSERYLEMRSAYAGLREDAVSAIDRLQLLERVVPGFSVPQGPVDTLAALDERIQALDAAVMPLISAGTTPTTEVAQQIADRTRLAEEALSSVQERLDGLRDRLDGLRADVASFADSVITVVNIGALIMILLLLYIAFLHLVLFRAGQGYRRPPSA